MDRDDRLAELFGRWKQAQQAGRPQTPEELCASHPDLLTTFVEVLPQLAAVDALFDDEANASVSSTAKPFDVGGYQSLTFHKEGGLGVVLVGEEVELRRTVAIKCIKAKALNDPAATDRFVHEAELTARLDHPGVVPIYRMGRDADGLPFYSMRFVQGETLAEAIARYYASKPSRAERNVEFRRLLRSLIAVCETIAFAHSRKVIHRDLKPDNMILGPFGETLVLDWGLAKRIDRVVPSIAGASSASDSLRLSNSPALRTLDGTIKGSPAYMSPEQARGEVHGLGPQTDIYSLGATLFVLLTGKAPFTGNSAIEVVEKVKAGPTPSPRQVNLECDKPLEAICRKAMSHRPEDRYADARDLAHDLECWLADEPVHVWTEPVAVRIRRWMKRHRPVVAAMVTGLMIVMLAAIGFGIQERRNSERERAERQRADKNAAVAVAAQGLADRNAEQAQANQKKAEAETQRATEVAEAERRSRDRAEEMAYAHQIRLAQLQLDSGEPKAAFELLETTRADLRGWEYRYLQGQVNKARRAFRGIDKLECLAVSPDGKQIASGGWDTTVKIWDAETGRRLVTLKGHTERIISLAFSHDGNYIASGSADKTVKIWDLQLDRELLTYRGHADAVYSVAFSSDDSQILSASMERSVKLWDVKTGQLIRALGNYPNSLLAAAFIPGGKRVAIVCDDTIRIVDSESGKELLNLKGHTGGINCVSTNSNGTRLVSAGWDNNAIIWNAQTGEKLVTCSGHRNGIIAAAFSPDGSRLVTGSSSGMILIFNVENGQSVQGLVGPKERVSSVAYYSRIATSSLDGTIRIWDPSTAKELLRMEGSTKSLDPGGPSVVVRGDESATPAPDLQIGKPSRSVQLSRPPVYLKFAPDGRKLAAAVWDGTARLYDPYHLQELASLKGRTTYAISLAFSTDGRRLVLAQGVGMGFSVWDVQTRKELLYRNLQGPWNHGVYGIAFSPDGKRIVLGSDSFAMRICDAATGGDVLTLPGHSAGVTQVIYSADGNRIFSSSFDKSIRIWDAHSGQEKQLLRGHLEEVWAIALNRDETRLVSASFDNTARIWDVPSGQVLQTLRGHSEDLLAVAFSPDGRRVVSGSVDKTIRIWDARNGQELLTLKGHAQKVNSVTFSPDGKLLASSSDDAIAIWDPEHP